MAPIMFGEFGINAGYVEELHNLYRQAPQSVAPEWRTFFDSYESGEPEDRARSVGAGNGAVARSANGSAGGNVGNGTGNGVTGGGTTGATKAATNGNGAANGHAAAAKQERLFDEAASQARVYALVNAYRVRGHLFAKVDPLGGEIDKGPWRGEIDLSTFGLSEADLDTTFPTAGVFGLADRARCGASSPTCRRPTARPSAWSTPTSRTSPRAAGCKRRWSRRKTAPLSPARSRCASCRSSPTRRSSSSSSTRITSARSASRSRAARA